MAYEFLEEYRFGLLEGSSCSTCKSLYPLRSSEPALCFSGLSRNGFGDSGCCLLTLFRVADSLEELGQVVSPSPRFHATLAGKTEAGGVSLQVSPLSLTLSNLHTLPHCISKSRVDPWAPQDGMQESQERF